MGELLCPCLVQGSVGVVYPVRPQEEQPQWRGSSGNLDSAPAGTPELSVCRAWRLRGGAADVLSWGRSVLAVLGPPGLCLSRGRRDPGLCPGALCSGACAVGFALPGRAAPSAEPPPEPLQLLRVPPGPAVRAAALRELGALSWVRSCCYCPREPEGILALLGPAPTPREPLSPGKVGAAPASPGRGSPVLGTLAPASARLLLSPAPPPWRPLFLYFFFPIFLP